MTKIGEVPPPSKLIESEKNNAAYNQAMMVICDHLNIPVKMALKKLPMAPPAVIKKSVPSNGTKGLVVQ